MSVSVRLAGLKEVFLLILDYPEPADTIPAFCFHFVFLF